MKNLITLLLCLCLSTASVAQDTFSIIAVDPATGEVGSAGASCVDGASAFGGIIDIITKIIPGRGGVNSQAYVCIPNVNLNNAITEMENGATPSEIIDYLFANDACNSQGFDPQFRQYGVADFDTNGDPRTAGFTGNMADDYKDDLQGATYSVQGNILLGEVVLNNMQDNFNSTTGSLADKLMAAMQGANLPGADTRCLARGTSSTSAYLLVYKADDDVNDPYIRLNIEEMPFGEEPIDSLQNLYDQFLGVNDVDLASQFQAYPNPAIDVLQLSYSNLVFPQTIALYNLEGRIINTITPSKENNRQEVDVSQLTTGVYFLKITTLQGAAVLKFIKE